MKVTNGKYDKLLIIGASGHGKVVADIALKINKWHSIAFLDDDESLKSSIGLDVIGKSSDAFKFINHYDIFVGIGNNAMREKIQKRLESEGASIPVLIHPRAIVGEQVEFGAGTVVMAVEKLQSIADIKITQKLSITENNHNWLLSKVIYEEAILVYPDCSTKNEILDDMVRILTNIGYVKDDFLLDVYKREVMGPTVIEKNIAIPHGTPKNVIKPAVGIAILKNPLAWSEGIEVDCVFMLALRELGQLEGVQLMPINEWNEPNYWLSCITLNGQVRPLDIMEALEKENIETRPIWKPMHLQPFFEKYDFIGGDVSEKLFENGVCLPSDTKMSDEDLEKVVEITKRLWKQGAN